MFKELPEGQTHSFDDGCGMPEHNSVNDAKNQILDEIEEMIVNDYFSLSGRESENTESENLVEFRVRVREHLESALTSYAREITEAMIPEEYQRIPISDRPKLYEDKAWLGWNAAIAEFRRRMDEALGINPPCGNCHKDHEGRTLCGRNTKFLDLLDSFR